MRRSVTRLAFVSLFFVSLLAAGSSVALADPGNGATQGGGPLNVTNSCFDTPDGLTLCVTEQGESHYVYTAAGGFNTQANFKTSCLSEYDTASGAFLTQSCYTNSHVSFHSNPNEIDVQHAAFTFTVTDASGAVFCYTTQFHEVNGQVQYDNLVNC